MNEHPGTSGDLTLGEEAYDPRTQLSDVIVDASRAELLARKRTWSWVLAAAALILLSEQVALGFTLYTSILGDLAGKFQTSGIVWFFSIWFLVGAVLSPLGARFGDLYGKRRALIIVTVAGFVGVLVTAFASSFEMLLLGRVISAPILASVPITIALVREVFPPKFVAVTLGIVTAGTGITAALGPLISGALVAAWGLSAPFFFHSAILAVGLFLLLVVVPESPSRVTGKLDFVGAGLLGVGALATTWSLSEISARGWTDPLVIVGVVGGVALVVAWYVYSNKVKNPLISPALLKRRATVTPAIVSAVCNATISSVGILVSLMWSTPTEIAGYGRGLTPLEIGFWILPFGIVGSLVGVFVGMTFRSIGYRNQSIIAGIAIAGAAGWIAFNVDGSPTSLIVAYAVLSLGFGGIASSFSLILLATPPDQRGIAVGVSSTFSAIVGGIWQQVIVVILGTSVLTVIGGTPFYSQEAFSGAWIFIACGGVLACIVGFAIPHGRRIKKSDRNSEESTLVGG